jgi:predicted  nucleic acid-binding Zn-ribbon protein
MSDAGAPHIEKLYKTSDAEMEKIRQEMDNLKKEIMNLQKELEKIKKSD